MPLKVHQFACLSDNYGFLIRDEASGETGCIDTPDADAILAELGRLGWALSLIMNTHWHPDHAGGNAKVQEKTGCRIVGPQEVTRIAPLDRPVVEGDVVELGDTHFEVLDTGGHTLGHVTYVDAADGIAFVGDTLFALGCGRLFEGDAAQMMASLGKLAALPDDTRVYCGHEYTEKNLQFALTLEPGNPSLRAKMTSVQALRRAGKPTVPSTIGDEKATNPFLRTDSPELAASVRARLPEVSASDPVALFAAVRGLKDRF